jgi:ribosomal subunit interface protein
MNVRFTGRHVGIGEADRAYAARKVEALVRYHRGILDVEVRVMMDGSDLEKVELQADLGKSRAVAVAGSPSFRPAFDRAVEILKRQLLRDKEKAATRRRRPRKRAPSGANP